jgi:tetratricopeptide (TPR) repeat protein
MRKHKFYTLITIVSAAILLASCASDAGSESAASPVNAVSTAEIVAQAEALFRERQNTAKLREAVALLGKARNPDKRDYEIEWQFARFNYFLGKQTENEKEAAEAFEKCKQAGRIAARIEPNKPEGHFWFAANLGEQAKESPVTVGIKSVDDIREAMNKVIELQPDYQGASAYDALAQIELTTGLFGGKAEKAIEYLEKALELEKQNAYIYLHLAEAYLATGRRAEAKKHLQHILQMKPAPEYAFEYKEVSEKAKKLLGTRF